VVVFRLSLMGHTTSLIRITGSSSLPTFSTCFAAALPSLRCLSV